MQQKTRNPAIHPIRKRSKIKKEIRDEKFEKKSLDLNMQKNTLEREIVKKEEVSIRNQISAERLHCLGHQPLGQVSGLQGAPGEGEGADGTLGDLQAGKDRWLPLAVQPG